MPTEEFTFEDFSEHAMEHLLTFVVILELRDKVYGLLALHIRDKT